VNGDVYDGEWRVGRKHGAGTYHHAATGSHYYGQWKNGRQMGYGELVHANHKYYGRFKNNMVGYHHHRHYRPSDTAPIHFHRGGGVGQK